MTMPQVASTSRAYVETASESSWSFAGCRDRHRGASILVCGCGPSLSLLDAPERYITIGVNDIGRRFTPDYLVVVNDRRQFSGERFGHVERSRAKAVFSQLEHLPLTHSRLVRFRLGRRGGTDRADAHSLHYSCNSPYVAVNLARHMGASRIGVLGVDFTGHPLANRLEQIDRDYGALAAACRADGIELVNLSPMSSLQSLPRMSLFEWNGEWREVAQSQRRVFFVHYRFLSCGTVFESGLREAANQLGIAHEHAYWDDAHLKENIERFQPDLLFVVHGRKLVQRCAKLLERWRSAVWLLDEPYEVDDTSAWSKQFATVFVNDPATLERHAHAHELPVAYAPSLHYASTGEERRYRTGFVGGANPTREAMLLGLTRRGLLDYVVGGPWRDKHLCSLNLSLNIPAEQTAQLYRDTSIVLNVFRDRHHFNRSKTAGVALNPRIVEALACGSLVISEPRAGVSAAFPELPTFRSEAEAAELIQLYLNDKGELRRVRQACAARLVDATYQQRLRTVMNLAFPESRLAPSVPSVRAVAESTHIDVVEDAHGTTSRSWDDLWDDVGTVVRRRADGEWVIDTNRKRGPGMERGLASRKPYNAAELSFEACLEPGAALIAKLHQADPYDQTTNSYHLFMDEQRAYVARHNHVFRKLQSPREAWVHWRLRREGHVLTIWRNDEITHRVRDGELESGYAFIGAQGGLVRIRNLQLVSVEREPIRNEQDTVEVLRPVQSAIPRLSIVTTVYDRVDCLRRCLDSRARLSFDDYEHIIVSDHPEEQVLARINDVIAQADDPRIGFYNLRRRHNNWGIAPAAAGLRHARGEFVAFLSDDNGYLPDHFESLIGALDRDPSLGFVYSSCQYDARLILAHPVPRPGRIDLGQPLFRRELFELHLNDSLPFDVMAWDWSLIDTFMRKGVRWRHINRPTFIFRLARYPHLIAS